MPVRRHTGSWQKIIDHFAPGRGSTSILLRSGVAYVLFSIYLKRRQFWAVLGSLILASIQLLFTAIAAVSLKIITLTKSANTLNFATISLNLLGSVSVILMLAQLIYHLALSFEAIKHVPVEEQRGFEPLMIQPINNPDIPPSSEPSGPALNSLKPQSSSRSATSMRPSHGLSERWIFRPATFTAAGNGGS